MERCTTRSVEETRNAGARHAKTIGAGDCIALTGGLGTGKTEFIRGLVAALGNGDAVRSPTFSLVNSYATPAFTIHHFDFYRLKTIVELDEIGFYEYLADDAVCCIEWADMFPEALPETIRVIEFKAVDDTTRTITIRTP